MTDAYMFVYVVYMYSICISIIGVFDHALRDNTCMREDLLMAKEYSPIW